MACVLRTSLYVYGGVLEKEEKQFYLNLHKLSEWKTIHEQPSLPDWIGTDSEGWESGSGSDSDSESDDSD
ncbi:putative kelch repeat protein [Operophtera brumata]|uniref:Putative kelch repeat protein n=1 Tax=Operophtera brumata TaxID=104452 RepID=A0A0L7LMJ9_OPEBR|nr:putative kelch repeat protein [Operophtera brumata]